jgi:hypothetical protein
VGKLRGVISLRNLIKFIDCLQWDETPPGQLPLEPLLGIAGFLPVSSLSSLPPPPESRCQTRHLRPAMNKNDIAERADKHRPASRKESGATNTVPSEQIVMEWYG